MFFEIGFFMVLFHFFLEEPVLEGGGTCGQDEEGNDIEVELPGDSLGDPEVILFGNYKLVGKGAQTPTERPQAKVGAN